MKVNIPIIYSQWDSRWSNNFLGFNKALPYNMYNFGCLVTCLAMVNRYFGKDTDPGRLNETYKSMGAGKAFVKNGGDYISGGNNLVYGDIKEKRTATPTALTDAHLAEIRDNIDNGYPVIIGIDVNPKTVAYDSHFVVIVDYNPENENDFTIADPLGGKVRSLRDYLGWFKPSARTTIESYVICTGPKPKLNQGTVAVPKDDFEKLVHNSTQWDKITEYLKPGADPKTTQYEELQTVVAGIKSRQTDLENRLKQANSERDIARQEVENQKDKLANVQAECQREIKIKIDEYEALKATIPNIEKLRGQYEGTIKELQGELREAQKAVGLAELEIARVKNELADCRQGLGFWDKLWHTIQNIFRPQ